MKLWKVAAPFLVGVGVTAAVFGIATAIDGSSDDPPSAGDSVSDVTGDDNTDGQVLATDGECLTAADVYEAVRPSVVEIDVAVTTSGPFGQQQSSGTGTGVVLDEEGRILTNNHVVGDADTISVRFDDGDTTTATLLGTDPANDLAVIQVDPDAHDLVPATLGDSDELRVGDPVLAIGNPFNLEGTLTQGIVSALDRIHASNNSSRPIRDMIQTDAAINPGNSGGPLLNCEGEVIGINTLLENPTGDSVNVGIGFAVSSNTASSELDELIAGEPISHSWLGVAGQDVSPALADELGLGTDEGVYLTLVTAGSPADDAGLVAAFSNENQAAGSADVPPGGDVITAVDGEKVTSVNDLATYLDTEHSPGDTVELTVVRDGEEITLEATLADWPS